MARRGSRTSRFADGFPIASPRLMRVPVRLAPLSRLSAPALIQYEDRRVYHPLGSFRPALTVGPRSSARVTVRRPRFGKVRFEPSREVLRFSDPRRVIVCARRKVRREVLIAKGLSGGGHRKRNYWSGISCR